MDSFERQIEEDAIERIEQACAIEREVTARRCVEIALEREAKTTYDQSAAMARLIAAAIKREFGLTDAPHGNPKSDILTGCPTDLD